MKSMISIDQSKQKGKSFECTFSNGEKIILPEAIVFQYSIFPGKKFSESTWQAILEAASKFACFEQILRFLAIKTHTEFELKKKLIRKGFKSNIIGDALEKAKGLNLINDLSIVKQFIHEQLDLGRFGKNRIIQKLQRRGIKSEVIRTNLSTYYSEKSGENVERVNALKVGERKLRVLDREPDYRKKKEKLLRFLANRGFSSSICYDTANQLLREIKSPSFH